MEKTAEEMLWERYRKLNWVHEYAENGVVNFNDCMAIASQQCAALKEENERLREALLEVLAFSILPQDVLNKCMNVLNPKTK